MAVDDHGFILARKIYATTVGKECVRGYVSISRATPVDSTFSARQLQIEVSINATLLDDGVVLAGHNCSRGAGGGDA